MAKRFTDTEKWKKSFYKKLTPAYKCFWNFITDDCDHNGVWEVEDVSIIEIRIGAKIDIDTALYAFNEDEKRIHVFDAGRKWFILPFVSFQYGELNANNRLHESVRRYLEFKDLLVLIPVKGPLSEGVEAPKDKDKDKEQDKDKERLLATFEDFWKAYPSRNGKKVLKQDALKEFKKLKEENIPDLMIAVKNYSDSGQYPKDPPRFFKDGYWREWMTPARFPEKVSAKNESLSPGEAYERAKEKERWVSPSNDFKSLVKSVADKKGIP